MHDRRMSALDRLHAFVRRWLVRYEPMTPQPTIDVTSSSVDSAPQGSTGSWQVTVSAVPAAAAYQRTVVGWANVDDPVRWMLVRASLQIVVSADTPQRAASDAIEVLSAMDDDVVLGSVQEISTSHGVTPPFAQLAALRLMDMDQISLDSVEPLSVKPTDV
jgi:hypothetical protein